MLMLVHEDHDLSVRLCTDARMHKSKISVARVFNDSRSDAFSVAFNLHLALRLPQGRGVHCHTTPAQRGVLTGDDPTIIMSSNLRYAKFACMYAHI